jgi:hypothetical protein
MEDCLSNRNAEKESQENSEKFEESYEVRYLDETDPRCGDARAHHAMRG